jgi:hypothetical protein
MREIIGLKVDIRKTPIRRLTALVATKTAFGEWLPGFSVDAVTVCARWRDEKGLGSRWVRRRCAF